MTIVSEHEKGQHATLSPSAAERWTTCPASIRMSAQVPDEQESVYAAEGTLAHSVSELRARHEILNDVADLEGSIQTLALECEINGWDWEEMWDHAGAYVELIQERMAKYPDSTLLLEQRVFTGIDECWGTSDAVIVSPVHVEIVDYKYGMGVAVQAEGNPQLRLYGVGALEVFGDLLGDVETVITTVHQPRLGHVLSAEISAEDLKVWRDGLKRVAAEALLGSDRFGPSEEACRWCPASGLCRAQMEFVTARDFSTDPDLLDESDMAEALRVAPMVRDWLDALTEKSLDRAYSQGKHIPGYKVVQSNGRRSIKDEHGFIEEARKRGRLKELTVVKPQTIGNLEKILGDSFDKIAGPYVVKGEGKPSLVPESDKRAAINPHTQAAADFKEDQ